MQFADAMTECVDVLSNAAAYNRLASVAGVVDVQGAETRTAVQRAGCQLQCSAC